MKRAAETKNAAKDLLRQLERSYNDKMGYWRHGNIVDEQRYILAHAVQRFTEMEPNGIYNYCCGGGGWMLAITEFSKRRIQVGKVKADQIAGPCAEVVATSCIVV